MMSTLLQRNLSFLKLKTNKSNTGTGKYRKIVPSFLFKYVRHSDIQPSDDGQPYVHQEEEEEEEGADDEHGRPWQGRQQHSC